MTHEEFSSATYDVPILVFSGCLSTVWACPKPG